MSYFEELDAWLAETLLAYQDDDDEETWFARVKKDIKAKILESYRNGQKAGLEPEKRAPKETERENKPRRFWRRRSS